MCIDEVVAKAIGFSAACHGSKDRDSVSDVHKEVWATPKPLKKTTCSYPNDDMEVGCQVVTT